MAAVAEEEGDRLSDVELENLVLNILEDQGIQPEELVRLRTMLEERKTDDRKAEGSSKQDGSGAQ